jgi:hypothetical protein
MRPVLRLAEVCTTAPFAAGLEWVSFGSENGLIQIDKRLLARR